MKKAFAKWNRCSQHFSYFIAYFWIIFFLLEASNLTVFIARRWWLRWEQNTFGWFPEKSFHISREFGTQKIDRIVHQCILTKPIPPKNKRIRHDCLCHLKLAKINLDALFYLFSVVLCCALTAMHVPCSAK